ncbi:MAG: GNAT family N-acetyltransferase, partial [Pseudomonadota bacterium]
MTKMDTSKVSKLAQESFVATYAEFNTPEDMQNHLQQQLSVDAFDALLADGDGDQVYLAYDDGFDRDIPIGFFQFSPRDWQSGNRKAVEILRFYIQPDVIGGGFGRKLMEACVDQARELGYSLIWLGVWDRNQRAIGFYQRLGFAHVGEKTFVLGSDVQSDW